MAHTMSTRLSIFSGRRTELRGYAGMGQCELRVAPSRGMMAGAAQETSQRRPPRFGPELEGWEGVSPLALSKATRSAPHAGCITLPQRRVDKHAARILGMGHSA